VGEGQLGIEPNADSEKVSQDYDLLSEPLEVEGGAMTEMLARNNQRPRAFL